MAPPGVIGQLIIEAQAAAMGVFEIAEMALAGELDQAAGYDLAGKDRLCVSGDGMIFGRFLFFTQLLVGTGRTPFTCQMTCPHLHGQFRRCGKIFSSQMGYSVMQISMGYSVMQVSYPSPTGERG